MLHWDHHELVFAPPTWWDWTGGNPVQPTPAYHGTDGGIDRSGVDAAGAMTFTSLNEGIATSLLTSLDIGRGVGNNDATFAGMQDTGTGGHRAGDAARTWFEGIDGDGGPIAVDPSNPSVVFGTDNDSLIRSTNGGATWFTAGLPQVIPIDAVGATNPVDDHDDRPLLPHRRRCDDRRCTRRCPGERRVTRSPWSTPRRSPSTG